MKASTLLCFVICSITIVVTPSYCQKVFETNVNVQGMARVRRVFKASPETFGADMSEDHHFDESAWEKVVAAQGNFSVIGIKIETNTVVPGFEDYVKGKRASRIHVE